MLYESYENKIKHVAKAKNVVVRFRVLIILLFSVIGLLTISYALAKGSVPGGISGFKEITYGEEFDFSANSFFSDCKLEYSYDGGTTWVDEAPYRAGNYLVRTVTDRLIGSDNGKAVSITILPKKVDVIINEDSVGYGVKPTISLDLIDNDYVKDYDIKYDNLAVCSTLVEASNVLVYDNEEDVSYCYDFNYVSKNISFNKLPITIKPTNYSKVYDGSLLDNISDYEIVNGGFINGDDAKIFTSYQDLNGNTINPIDVGNYNIVVSSGSVYNGDNEVLNYDVNYEVGNLEIVKRQIKVLTSSQTFTYDSFNHYDLGVSIAYDSLYDLVDGHYLEVYDYQDITNVGVVDNVLKVKVLDKDGTDVTSNYDILYEYGKLEVKPCSIVLYTGSSTKVYDGMPLVNIDEFGVKDGYNLPSGFSLVLGSDNYSSITLEGTTDNVLELKIIDELGNDVSSNFDISYEYGKLEITKYNIGIMPKQKEKVYDGIPLTSNEVVVTYGKDILANHKIEIVTDGSIVNVGDVINYITSYKIYDEDGVDVTDSLEVEVLPSILTITPRAITVRAKSLSHEYDGNPYLYDGSLYDVIDGNFIGDDHIFVSVRYEMDSIITPGEYNCYIDSYSISDEYKANYDISIDIEASVISIYEREIIIKAKSLSNAYDGNIFESNLVDDITLDRLVNGHRIDIVTDGKIKDVGSINNNVVSFVIYDEEGNDVSSYYNPIYEVGTLTIVPRVVEIKLDPTDIIYNSAVYDYCSSDGAYYIVEGDIVLGEILVITEVNYYDYAYEMIGNPCDAGRYFIEFVDYDIINGLRDNYEIICKEASLFVIEQLDVYMKPVSVDSIYDGKEYVYDEYLYTLSTSLYNMDYITVKVCYFDLDGNRLETAPKNVGTYHIYVYDYEFYGHKESNYYFINSFNENDVFLNIVKRCITLQPKYIEKVYDGNVFGLKNSDVLDVNNDLVSGHSISITSDSYYVNAGYYDTVISSHLILDEDGIDVTYNYEHNYLTGVMYIMSRSIYVKPIDKQTIYDGMEYDEYGLSDYEVVINDKWIYDFIGEDGIKVNVSYYLLDGSMVNPIDAGMYFIKINGITFNDDTIPSNYDVYYDEVSYEAILTINKRVLNVKALTPADKCYDGIYYTYDEFEMNVDIISGDGLVLGESIIIYDNHIKYSKVDDDSFSGNPYNVGRYGLYVIGYEIIGRSNDNYALYCEEEVYFNINKTDVFVKIKELDDIYYNGFEHRFSISRNNCIDINSSVVSGETIIVSEVRYVVVVDDIEMDVDVIFNAGVYRVYPLDYEIENGLKENYNVSFVGFSQFEIFKRDVTIEPINYGSVTYDGTPFIYDYSLGNYKVSLNSIHDVCSNDIFKIKVSYTDYNTGLSYDGPINASTYRVDIVDVMGVSMVYSDKGDITRNYNISFESVDFIIKPRKIRISPIYLDDYIYDGNVVSYPSSSFEYLDDNEFVGNDSIVVDVRFEDEFGNVLTCKNARTYYMYINGHTFVNDDVIESNYEIIYSDVPVIFNIIPRVIDITLKDVEDSIYDGNYHYYPNSYDSVIANNMVDGEYIYAQSFTYYYDDAYLIDPLHVGRYYVYIDSVSYSDNTLDTNYYINSITPIDFRINQREITVELLPMVDVIYDGKAHGYEYYANNFTVVSETSVVPGEEIYLFAKYYSYYDDAWDLDDPINASKYLVTIGGYYKQGELEFDSVHISDYKINCNTTQFEIKPIDLEISLFDIDSFVYDNYYYEYLIDYDNCNIVGDVVDGEVVYVSNVRYVKVIAGQEHEVDEVIDQGLYRVYPNSYETVNGQNRNYNVTFVGFSEFSIRRRVIEISPIKPEDKEYDGISYSYDKYPGNYDIVGSMASDEEITIDVWYGNKDNQLINEICDAGTYYINVKDIHLDGRSLDNYEISISNVSYVIFKRVINVWLDEQDDVVYNGLSYDYLKASFNVSPSFIGKDNIIVNVKFYDENQNEVLNPIDAGTYYIKLDGYDWVSGSKDYNYDVILGTKEVEFRILPKVVNISLNDISDKVYDGIAYQYLIDLDNCVSDGLVLDHKVYVSKVGYEGPLTNGLPLHVGHYGVNILDFEVLGCKKSNYYPVYENKEFDIIPKDINIELFDMDDKVYDGKTYLYDIHPNNFIDVSSGILPGEVLTVYVDYYKINRNQEEYVDYPVDAHTYIVRYSYYLKDDGYNSDYNIYADDIYFTINKMDLTIKLHDFSGFVYGETIEFLVGDGVSNCDVISGDMPDGQSVSVTAVRYVLDVDGVLYDLDKAPVNVGLYRIYAVDYCINNGNDDNYNVTFDGYTSYEITRREVSILPSVIKSRPYNGNPISYPNKNNNFEYQEDTLYELVNNEIIKVYVYYTLSGSDIRLDSNPVNAGDYTIHIDYVMFIKGDINNYSFNFGTSDFSITPYEVTITASTLGTNTVYDGLAKEYGKDQFTLNKPMINGDSIKVKTSMYLNSDKDMVNPIVDVINAGTYKHVITDIIFESGLESNYSFNIKNSNFVVKQRNVIINTIPILDKIYDGNSVIYDGSLWSYSSKTIYELVSGDTLNINVKFKNSKGQTVNDVKNAGNYYVNLADYVVNDSLIMTDNYDIELEFIDSFTISPVDVVIRGASSLDNIYDGYEVNDVLNQFEIISGSFVGSEGISLTTKIYQNGYATKAIKAGYYDNVIDEVTYNKGTIKDNYNLSFENGTICILRRDIYISPTNQTHYYNNEVFNNYPLDGYVMKSGYSLADTDSMNVYVKYYNEAGNVSPIDIGSYDIYIDYVYIFNQNKEDVTSSYNVIFDGNSKLDIKVLSISVTPDSLVTHTYNGYNYDRNNIGYEYIIDNTKPIEDQMLDEATHRLVFQIKFINQNGVLVDEAINVGTYQIVYTGFDIYNNGVLIENSNLKYDVNIIGNTTLVINKCDLYLSSKINEVEYTYDGNIVNYPKNEFTAYGLADCDEISLITYLTKDNYIDRYYDDVINVGTYYHFIDEDSISFTKGLASNYNIIIEGPNLFIVNPRPITITPYSLDAESKVYDGSYISYSTSWSNVVVTRGELVEGDLIKGIISLKTSNSDPSGIVSVRDAGVYSIYIDDYEISGTLKENYQVKLVNLNKNFTIEKRKIVIETASVGPIEYDGKAHSYLDLYSEEELKNFPNIDYSRVFNVISGDLLNNELGVHEIKVSQTVEPASLVKVGTIANSISIAVIDTLSGDYTKDYVNNYDVTYLDGVITVVPRNITVLVGSAIGKYQGEEKFVCKDYEIISGSIVDGDSVTVKYTTYDNEGIKVLYDGNDLEFTYDGILYDYYVLYENTLELKIKNSNVTGDISSSCYNITYVSGSLKVFPIIIEFSLNDVTKEYTGKDHVYNEDYITITSDEALQGNDKLTFDWVYTNEYGQTYEVLRYAGVYTIKVNKDDVYINGVKNLYNYMINIVDNEATYTITKKVLKVYTYDYEWLYDGMPHQYLDWYYTDTESQIAHKGMLITGHSLLPNPDLSIQPTVTGSYDYDNKVLSNNFVENKIEFVIVDDNGLFVDEYGYYYHENYDIIYSHIGVISVTDKMCLDTTHNNYTYNGIYQEVNVDSLHLSTLDGLYTIDNYEVKVLDYILYDKYGNSTKEVKDSGSYLLEILDYEIYHNGKLIYDNGILVVDNDDPNYDLYSIYEIVSVKNYVYVSVRDIYLKGADEVYTYDGIMHEIGKYELLYDSTLASNHVLVVESATDINQKKAFEGVTDVSVKNYLINVVTIYDEFGNDVTQNYGIHTYAIKYPWETDKEYNKRKMEYYGKITIKPRYLYIETDSFEKNFDGLITCIEGHNLGLYGNGYYDENLDSGLLSNHSISSVKYVECILPGTYINRPTFVIVDELGDKVTSNYQIYDGGLGEIVINKLDITLVALSKEKYIDGTPLFSDEWTIDVSLSDPIIDLENKILLRAYDEDKVGLYVVTYYIEYIDISVVGGIYPTYVNENEPDIIRINASKSKIKEVKEYYTLDEYGNIVYTGKVSTSSKTMKSIYNVTTVDGTLTVKNTYGNI